MLLAGAALIGAAAPAVAQDAGPETLPPYTPAYEPTDVDERGLWMQMDEAERALQKSPLLVQDPELQLYVRRVLCNTVGDDRCAGVRIYIVEMPLFNASMGPNGVMQVYTGLLLRVHSEAELGAVLGHEFAHFELRHSLAAFKKARNTTDIMAWISVVAGGLSGGYGGGNLIQLAMLGSFFSYAREQEQEADLLGLAYLGTSEYPSSAAASVWANLMAEEDATYAGRERKKKQKYNAGFLASHPTSLARETYLTEKAGEIGDAGDTQVAGHFAAIGPFLPAWLDAQTKLNDFGGTDYILNSLAEVEGWTPQLLYARGQMYQNRANPRDLVSAAQFYREALDAGYAGPEAHRNLGLALMRSGNAAEAVPELQNYLRLMPDAPDYGAINALVPANAQGAAATISQPLTEEAPE
jgi:predicted Zn-dependent protease